MSFNIIPTQVREVSGIDLKGQSLEVAGFCCLGDTREAAGGVLNSVLARIGMDGISSELLPG